MQRLITLNRLEKAGRSQFRKIIASVIDKLRFDKHGKKRSNKRKLGGSNALKSQIIVNNDVDIMSGNEEDKDKSLKFPK